MSTRPARIVAWVIVGTLLISAGVFYTPLATRLLHASGGSFAAESFSSLALAHPQSVTNGIHVGDTIPVVLENHTRHREAYYWRATQASTLVDSGVTELAAGSAAHFSVTTTLARRGHMVIELVSTPVFLTLSLLLRPSIKP